MYISSSTVYSLNSSQLKRLSANLPRERRTFFKHKEKKNVGKQPVFHSVT